MKAIVLIISLLWWINAVTSAQCDRTLVQKATEMAGKDAVLVRDFKVKLKEGDKRNPSPSNRYTVLMQKGISYRFNVVGATENQEAPVLQLYDKSSLLASSYDFDKKQNISNFQYQCQRTGDYQVVLSFHNSKGGCAAGVMSMVVDSAFLTSRKTQEDTEEEVLYLGIENHLSVSTDSLGEDKFEVTIDNGSVTDKGNYYAIKVEGGTKAKVTVKQKDADGKAKEETVKEFKILPLPEPTVRLAGAKGEYVSSSELGMISHLEVIPGVYKVLEFFISSLRVSRSGFATTGEYLTGDQREFLKTLKPNDRFYLNDIKIEKPDGTILEIRSMEYFVR